MNKFGRQNLIYNRSKLLLSGVIVLALLLRLIYLFQIRSTPLFDFLAADSGDFEKFALKILQCDFIYQPSLYFNPFYPFFLLFFVFALVL